MRGKSPKTEQSLMPGTLYLVATPIGNLADIPLRALDVLRRVDAILCEDTRRTRILLQHYGIRNRLVSFHAPNETRRIPQVLRQLEAGRTLALVSDAGMPGLSDPGVRLVQRVWAAGKTVTIVPGPSAILAALVISGLPTRPFAFWGFLPRSAADQQALFQHWRQWTATHIAFETGPRLLTTLRNLAQWAPDQPVCLIKEITKVHERRYFGLPAAIAEYLSQHPEETAGEWVLLVRPAPSPKAEDQPLSMVRTMMRDLTAAGVKPRTAARMVGRWLQIPPNKVYSIFLEEQAH